MNEPVLFMPESAVSRIVGKELVVIQTDSGAFHHFSAETEPFLSFFRRAAPLSEFLRTQRTGIDDAEHAYLSDFVGHLLQLGVLRKNEEPGSNSNETELAAALRDYRRPVFLRHGETNLDEVTFAFLYG